MMMYMKNGGGVLISLGSSLRTLNHEREDDEEEEGDEDDFDPFVTSASGVSTSATATTTSTWATTGSNESRLVAREPLYSSQTPSNPSLPTQHSQTTSLSHQHSANSFHTHSSHSLNISEVGAGTTVPPHVNTKTGQTGALIFAQNGQNGHNDSQNRLIPPHKFLSNMSHLTVSVQGFSTNRLPITHREDEDIFGHKGQKLPPNGHILNNKSGHFSTADTYQLHQYSKLSVSIACALFDAMTTWENFTKLTNTSTAAGGRGSVAGIHSAHDAANHEVKTTKKKAMSVSGSNHSNDNSNSNHTQQDDSDRQQHQLTQSDKRVLSDMRLETSGGPQGVLTISPTLEPLCCRRVAAIVTEYLGKHVFD